MKRPSDKHRDPAGLKAGTNFTIQSDHELYEYIAEITAEMERKAIEMDYPMLAYFLSLAYNEAYRLKQETTDPLQRGA